MTLPTAANGSSGRGPYVCEPVTEGLKVCASQHLICEVCVSQTVDTLLNTPQIDSNSSMRHRMEDLVMRAQFEIVRALEKVLSK
jgi:hypothetical protein